MPGDRPIKRRVTATLDGFPAWALIEYEKVTKEGEKGALAYIIKRWAELDPTAKQHRITLDDFNGGGVLVGSGRANEGEGANATGQNVVEHKPVEHPRKVGA